MTSINNKYKIVYILGSGHSGSTLIDMIIGSSKSAFSVGELAFYSHYLNKIQHKKIDNIKGFDCTCGKKAWNCPFWKPVDKEIKNQFPIIKNRGAINTYKIFFNIINPFEKDFKFDIQLSKNEKVYSEIYKQIKKSQKKVNILVDSSKDPRRLYELLNDKDIRKKDICVLYLLRDGRAYVNSFRKDIETINGLEGRNIFVTAFEWIGVQIAARRILKKYHLKNRVVKYHDFCENPERYIRDIYKFLGIKESYRLNNVFKRVNSTKYHNLHGNPTRYNKLKAIKRDTSWKNELGFFTKLAVSVIFYPLNNIWVFNNEPKKPFSL